MDRQQSLWTRLAEYARWAPSPHNTQPTRLKILDDRTAEVYFVRERGLPVGDPQGRFTFLTFGIFVEILVIAAAAHGYELQYTYRLEPLYRDGEPVQKIADLVLVEQPGLQDLDAHLILARRTSRLPYNNRPIPQAVSDELQAECRRYGHRWMMRNDRQAVRWVIELNRDALFHDLEHKIYRTELSRWLRYSGNEASLCRDGLSAAAMALPGWLVKTFMVRHWLFTAPGLKSIAQRIYTATMRGISTIGWIQGPYRTPEDWIRSGHLMIRLWLIMTKHGLYWQPYGSVITNDAARAKMIRQFAIDDEDKGRNHVWLLLRMGYSDQPPRSERLPLEEILL